MAVLDDLEKKLSAELFEVENNDKLSTDEKVEAIVKIVSAGCAALAILPIPLGDMLVLTPIQAYMGYKIGRVRDVQVSRQEMNEIIKEILGLVGMGLIARQLAVSAAKIIPGLGSLIAVPVVYGTTFAMGRVIDYYFVEKLAGRSVTEKAMKAVYQEARQTGEEAGKLWAQGEGKLKDISREFDKKDAKDWAEAIRRSSDRLFDDAKKTVESFRHGVRQGRGEPAKAPEAPAKPAAKSAAKKTAAPSSRSKASPKAEAIAKKSTKAPPKAASKRKSTAEKTPAKKAPAVRQSKTAKAIDTKAKKPVKKM
ncbi:hypothetical protein KDL45_04065 [bacterium]|nr:hypothetical protein [bacterium]